MNQLSLTSIILAAVVVVPGADARPAADPCTKCGGNSPMVNGFPFNGLHMSGKPNPEGVAYVRGSLIVPRAPKCDGGELGVDADGRLVARTRRSTCAHAQLTGASFAVDVTTASRPKQRIPLMIAEADEGGPGAGDRARTVFAYKIVVPGSSVSLCDRASARRLRQDLGLATGPADPHDVAPSKLEWNLHETDKLRMIEALHVEKRAAVGSNGPTLVELLLAVDAVKDPGLRVIVRAGELYDEGMNRITAPSAGWLNVSCLRDSLAKLDSYDIAPAGTADDAVYLEGRAAGLRMLTANYCGRAHYTTEKSEIEWTKAGGTVPTRNLEAIWSSRGAVCISGYRPFHKRDTIPDDVKPPGCRGGLCANEGAYVEAIASECTPKVGRCTGREVGAFASYVK
jgi:hypothetical protein